ncbi:MAG: undecaprenyl-phosphate glucose phosphotransferase [Muribaculum sp.]|nr:undecaprenyl-phosphate glucose phosphotransferase [Muribaculaceae bacterium]MCM1081771.1 undecaprenyl-phosphate glucose phosphotransferase [Muribaculum sp.]
MAFIVASIFDVDIFGFRVKVTWLAVNVSYLAAILLMRKQKQTRTMHVDRIVSITFKIIALQAILFFAIQTFLDSWVHNVSFYLWFYGMLVMLLPCSIVATRLVVKRYRKRGGNFSAAIIVGTNETARRLRDEMLSDPGYGYRFMGFFSCDEKPAMATDPEYRGTIGDIEKFLEENEVREVYYTLSGEDYASMTRVINIADEHVLQFYYVPQISRYLSRRTDLSNIGQVSVMGLRINPLQNIFNRMLKRAFDIAFSSVALICSPIIFVPVAIAIKLTSPGPVFFKQKRTGYLGKEFNCYKFRTMRVNDKSDSMQATRSDSRVTPLGHFLRHTSIDELPQFINVWLGDMSVVGPRPHMIKHTDDYRRLVDKYMMRHQIKPGITGWAQINGFRGQTEELWQMEKRVEYDIWYIENWHFMLDMKIIVMTIINSFRGEDNAF